MANQNRVTIVINADGTAAIETFGRVEGEAERTGRDIEGGTRAIASKIKGHWLGVTAAVVGAYVAIRKAISHGGSFIEVADSAEQYRTRLNTLLGSVEEGNRLFAEMAGYASRVPFQYEEIMGAATDLSGVMKGGVDEISRWMPLIGDLAAAYGMSIGETTSQVIRMYSSGAASADMFRERGILAMMGFEAGVSYSAEETRKKMFEAWQKADSQFMGATISLASTWKGLMSMLSDKWFKFRNDVMNAAPFAYLKSAASLLIKHLDDTAGDTEKLAERIGNRIIDIFEGTVLGVAGIVDTVGPGIKKLWDISEDVWNAYQGLPDWAKEVGVIGALVGGKKGVAVVAGLALLAERVKTSAEGLALVTEGHISLSDWVSFNADEMKATVDKFKAEFDAQMSGGGGLPAPEFDEGSLKDQGKKLFAEIRAGMEAARKQGKSGGGSGGVLADEQEEANKAAALWSWYYEARAEEKRQFLETQKALEEWDRLERIRLEEKGQREAFRKLEELEKEHLDIRKQQHENMWASMMETANLMDGEQGKWMGLLGAGMKGMMDAAEGADPYAAQLEQLADFYNRKLALMAEAGATEAELRAEFHEFEIAQTILAQKKKFDTYRNTANMIFGVLGALLTATGKNQKAMFYMQQAYTLAMAVMNTAQGVTSALATGNIAKAALIGALGGIQIATIVSTTMKGPSGGAATGGVSGGGGYSYERPEAPRWERQEEKKAEQPLVIQIYPQGHVITKDELARELVESIKKAEADGAH